MDFTFIRQWKIPLIIFMLFCLGTGIVLGYLETHAQKPRPIVTKTTIKPTATPFITDQTIPTPPPDLDKNLILPNTEVSANSKHLSVLFLGYGGAGHDGGYLSDTIILAYLNVTKKKLAFIHIPRDIWVNVTVGKTVMPMKVNAALAMGTKTKNYPTTTVSKDTILRASTLTKQAVTTITGLPIDFVVSVDFGGFSDAIDSLNGIDLTLKTAFDDPWYPVKGKELDLCSQKPEDVTAMSATMSGFLLEKQFPCRYEHLYFKVGNNHMDGETALKYARSRHTSSDFDRGLRQIALVRAVIDKLFSLKALDKIPQFYASLTKSVRTDITISQLETITPILKTIPDLSIVAFGLDTKNVLKEGKTSSGTYMLISKEGEGEWQEVQKYIAGKI